MDDVLLDFLPKHKHRFFIRAWGDLQQSGQPVVVVWCRFCPAAYFVPTDWFRNGGYLGNESSSDGLIKVT